MFFINAVLLSILLAVADSVGCPNGFIPHKQSCHAAMQQLATWAEAREYCATAGAGLCHVETEEEQRYLEGYVNAYKNSYWIGGFDQLEENIWIWDTNRTRIQSFFWSTSQPSGGPTHNCLYLDYLHHHRWADAECSNRMFFICELQAIVEPHPITNAPIKIIQGLHPTATS